MIQGSGRCHYHPERAGLGVCIECRRVICRECTTQFEGINRCASCLQRHLQALQTEVERSDWSPGNVLLALVAASVVFCGIWMVAAIAAGV